MSIAEFERKVREDNEIKENIDEAFDRIHELEEEVERLKFVMKQIQTAAFSF